MQFRKEKPGNTPSLSGFNKALQWSAAASAMVFEAAVWSGLGYLGDRYWGTQPWLLLAGSIVGLFAFSWRVYRLLDVLERGNRPRQGSSGSGRSESRS